MKDKEQIKKLLEKNKELGIEEKKRNKPRMILDNISIDYEKKEEIIDVLYIQNDIINNNYAKDEYEKEIEVKTFLRSFRNTDTKRVIE